MVRGYIEEVTVIYRINGCRTEEVRQLLWFLPGRGDMERFKITRRFWVEFIFIEVLQKDLLWLRVIRGRSEISRNIGY